MLSAVFAIAISQQSPSVMELATELRKAPTETVIQRGNFYYTKEDWQRSVSAYEILIERLPKQPLYRLRHGKSLIEIKQYANAIGPLRFARDAQHDVALSNFLLARAYAGLKMEDVSLPYLKEAVKHEFEDFDALKKANEFSYLKDNKDFLSLAELIEYPAVKKPGGRILDFLIGTWEYKTDDGLPAGQSTVAKTDKGYQVKEAWINPEGGQTTTTFHLKPEKGRWVYLLDSPDGRKGQGEVRTIPNGIERVGKITYSDGVTQDVKETLTKSDASNITLSTFHSYDEGESWVEVSRGTLALIAAPKPRPSNTVAVSAKDSPASGTTPATRVITVTVGGK